MNSKNYFELKKLNTSNIPISNIILFNNALYFENTRTLIINDIHLGFESALTNEGVFLPNTNINLIIKQLELLSESLKSKKCKVDKLIINGDLKHSFLDIDKNTIKELNLFFEKINESLSPKEIIVIKGNHDTFLNVYFLKKKISFLDEFSFSLLNEFNRKNFDVIITHGHKKFDLKKNTIYILGHEHPAVGIRKGTTFEQYKCFLFGKINESYIILPPSFTNISVGSNIFKGVFLSPLMQNLYKENDMFIMDFDIIVNENSEFFAFKAKELIDLN